MKKPKDLKDEQLLAILEEHFNTIAGLRRRYLQPDSSSQQRDQGWAKISKIVGQDDGVIKELFIRVCLNICTLNSSTVEPTLIRARELIASLRAEARRDGAKF